MENAKGTPSFKPSAYGGKQPLLPPKSPFPVISPSYTDYAAGHSGSSRSVAKPRDGQRPHQRTSSESKGSFPAISPSHSDYAAGHPGCSRSVTKPRDGQRHHQRTSSESFLIEEQPSWLDDLLDEPEMPVRKGTHRRSSSDSFAYLDGSSLFLNADNVAQGGFKNRSLELLPSWGPQEFDFPTDVRHSSFYNQINGVWESPLRTVRCPSILPSSKDTNTLPRLTGAAKETAALASGGTQRPEESSQDMKGPSDGREASQNKNPQADRREGSQVQNCQFEVDQKRVKQQFAQRSRVRKLQYIAELERNIQALQVEMTGVGAEIEFIDQQNLILNLENKALKQRLDSLQQEQLLKCFEHEMLEREIGRLRAFCHHQQQQQQQQQLLQPQQAAPTHGRSNSRDLDAQMANLSLKHKEANSGRDPFTGSLHI